MATVFVTGPADGQGQATAKLAPNAGVHHVTDDLVGWLENVAAVRAAGG